MMTERVWEINSCLDISECSIVAVTRGKGFKGWTRACIAFTRPPMRPFPLRRILWNTYKRLKSKPVWFCISMRADRRRVARPNITVPKSLSNLKKEHSRFFFFFILIIPAIEFWPADWLFFFFARVLVTAWTFTKVLKKVFIWFSFFLRMRFFVDWNVMLLFCAYCSTLFRLLKFCWKRCKYLFNCFDVAPCFCEVNNFWSGFRCI